MAEFSLCYKKEISRIITLCQAIFFLCNTNDISSIIPFINMFPVKHVSIRFADSLFRLLVYISS